MPPDEPAAEASLISARGVTVRRGGRSVLDGVDLDVGPGQIVTLIGPNGSGKTTFVRTVLGLVKPDGGAVERRTGLRAGYVPQTIQIDRTLPLTTRRFVAMAGAAAGGRLGKTADAALDAAAAEAGIAYLLDRAFQDLSGGEARRAVLARALLRDPDLLVLDEPTANVDVAGQAEFYDLIRAIRDRRGCGILLVSHDLHLVMAATDIVVCLNGHVCCSGRPEAVTRNPEYLALFGPAIAESHGLYTHAHDHSHDLSGEHISESASGRETRNESASGRGTRNNG